MFKLYIPNVMDIYDYSNPDTVLKKARNMGLEIEVSTRKDKKYMVYDGKKWIHFGQMGYEDYSKHKDKHRRDLFRTRNHKWADAEPFSPAFLSYFLLW
jgi:hypothetical protein